MSTSRFVQITDYCLVEYRYTNPSFPNNISADFLRIYNGRTDQVQIMNVDSAEPVTGNVQDRSAVKFTSGSYYSTDTNQLPTYLQFDQEMDVTTVLGNNVPYDEVRFHFLAGYNFEDMDGVLLKIEADERSGKALTLAQLVYLKTDTNFEFNPRPVLLGQRLYDRYVRVLIPSVKIINDQYQSLTGSPLQSQSLVGQITSDGGAFLRENPLHVKVIEIKSTDSLEVGSANYVRYLIGATSTVAINQSDEFGLLGAVIQPSAGGDYFEYFATWSGAFIEDFIERSRNISGFDFVVIHEVRVFEQVGSLFSETYSFQSIQESDFDAPNLFRPIISSAGTAVSYTLEYTMRLYNKSNSQQLIRTASYTGYDPARWGKNLSKISLLNQPEPFRIYNRVVSGPTLPSSTFINNMLPVQVFTPEISPDGVGNGNGNVNGNGNGNEETAPQIVTQIVTRTVPAFFDRSLVTVQSQTMNLNAGGQLEPESRSDTQTVYGQGDATIIMSPFDNYYKFTILKSESTAGNIPQPLDLGQNAKYYLVFVDNDGQKRRFEYLPDAKVGDPQSGDIVFKIPGAESEDIIKFSNREFWIVSKDGTDETGIYYGEFVTVKEMDLKRQREAEAEERSNFRAEAESRIADLERKLEETEDALREAIESTRLPVAVDGGGADRPRTRESVRIPAGVKEETAQQIKVPIAGLEKIQPKATKTSIVANIVPKVVKTVQNVTLPKNISNATVKRK